jgi:hypothetical protein
MSHAGLFRTLAAVVIAASLVSCRRSPSRSANVHFPDPRGPIHIKVACNNGISISITDQGNVPAWIVVKDPGEEIRWNVTGNVTIDDIRQKNGQPLPIDATGPQGHTPGTPVQSRVKSGVSGNYEYSIFAKCRPTGPPPNVDVPIVIDPVMIVR